MAAAGAAHADTSPASDSIFYVGSIAKQFVAACIALLEREGALALDDPVSRYVPRPSGVGRARHDRPPGASHRRREGTLAVGTRCAGRGRAGVGERGAARAAPRGRRARLRAGIALRLLEPRLPAAGRGRGRRIGFLAPRLRARAHLRAARHARDVLPGPRDPAARRTPSGVTSGQPTGTSTWSRHGSTRWARADSGPP